jgi:hypothetical protein
LAESAARRFGKRVVLRDQVWSVIPVAVPEHVRLGEEAVGADRPGGREEVGGPRGAQVVRPPHRLPHLPAQCGQLVHDRVGPNVPQGAEQVLAAHHVGHHGLGTGGAQPLSVGLAAADTDDLVPGGDELTGERCTQSARGAGEQYSHDFIPFRQVPLIKTEYRLGV